MKDSNVRYLNISDKSQRERLLEMLLGQLDGMVYRCKVDEHWTMEFLSAGCLQLTGYEAEDLLFNSRISYEEITHPLDRSRVRQEVNSAIGRGHPFNIEYRICHADGSIRWVWERGSLVHDQESNIKLIQGFVEDITRRRLHEEALTEAEDRYRSIFENATEGIFQTTETGHYLAVNPALARIYGYDSPQDLMCTLRSIDRQLYVDEQRRREFIALMQAEGKVDDFESCVYRRDGSIIWISENAHSVRDQFGKLRYYEGTVVDISERKSFERKISFQATHDSLTGLPNRVLLSDRLRLALHSAKRGREQLAVLFIDLDDFKKINDSLGHMAGDSLLQEIARRLQCCLRESDTVARIGGDEFVLLLPDLRGGSQPVVEAVRRILEATQSPCLIENREFVVGCSIGISMYPEDSEDADTLLKYADMAMYKAKQAGRNTFHFFTESLNLHVQHNLELEQQLRRALAENELLLYYQPQLDLASGKVTGSEALLRWQSAGGMILPGQFIPLAEKSGLIEALGGWVLQAVCKQLRDWLDTGYEVVPVAVNLSPRQFNNPELITTIRAVLAEYQIPTSLLKLEITESCMADNQSFFVRMVAELNALGLKVAIDDFGSGYSNMHCLRSMEADTLKVDRSFITSVDDHKHRAIYRAIISMAHSLNFKVIAEGVENRTQLDFLQSVGCDSIQGFYFSRPLPAADYCSLLQRGRRLADMDRHGDAH